MIHTDTLSVLVVVVFPHCGLGRRGHICQRLLYWGIWGDGWRSAERLWLSCVVQAVVDQHEGKHIGQ
jgi:hypothetical protein